MTVLVTGVNGFVGSNVALELLKSGYKVRGTVRGSNLESFKKAIGDKFPRLEVAQVDNVGTDDLTAVLRGVESIIHVAAPLPFGGSGLKENLNIAIEGYLNVLRQAVSNGINKVVLTGSYASTIDPSLKQAFDGSVTTEKDWGNVTEEELLESTDPMYAYVGAKTLAERAAWKFAQAHPSLDLSIIAPPFIFGPLADGFPAPKQAAALSSNRHIYTLLKGSLPPVLPPGFVDVRDVARAHVLALNVPKAEVNLEDKRFIVSGGILVWKDAVEYLHKKRPELKARLPAVDGAFPPFPGTPSTIDVTRAKVVLGIQKYYSWQETLENTVNSLLDAEKIWDAVKA